MILIIDNDKDRARRNVETLKVKGVSDDIMVFGSPAEMVEYFSGKKDLKNSGKGRATVGEYAGLLLHMTPNAIFTIDTDFRVTSWNRMAEELTGYSREEIIGEKCSIFCKHPCAESCELFNDKIKKPLIGMECTMKKKDGQIRLISKNSDILKTASGEIIGGIETFEDITDKKKSELILRVTKRELSAAYAELKNTQEQLVQSEKLLAVGGLASGVAHEVKNPLGVILQGINFLEGKVTDSSGKTKDVLAMMKKSVLRADHIIRSLVDFSRESKLDLKPDDLSSIVEAAFSLAGPQIKNVQNIEVIKEYGNDLPKALVDRARIEQVFINAILNSVYAMPKGGKIILRTYLAADSGDISLTGRNIVSVGKRMGDDQAVVAEIEDTGEGISQENIKKVFDPFFTTKPPGEGTGLGLSVTRNIIDMHGGLICIESEKGKGTRVIIMLRIAGGMGNG